MPCTAENLQWQCRLNTWQLLQQLYAFRAASHAAHLQGRHARSPSAASSSHFSVPRLALPTPDSPTASFGGLTRSTRRVLSGTPRAGTRSPSPFASPSRRSGTCDSAEPRALAELATLASALGESLMAADLPAIVAHKRRADIRLGEEEEEEDGMPAGVRHTQSNIGAGGSRTVAQVGTQVALCAAGRRATVMPATQLASGPLSVLPLCAQA